MLAPARLAPAAQTGESFGFAGGTGELPGCWEPQWWLQGWDWGLVPIAQLAQSRHRHPALLTHGCHIAVCQPQTSITGICRPRHTGLQTHAHDTHLHLPALSDLCWDGKISPCFKPGQMAQGTRTSGNGLGDVGRSWVPHRLSPGSQFMSPRRPGGLASYLQLRHGLPGSMIPAARGPGEGREPPAGLQWGHHAV